IYDQEPSMVDDDDEMSKEKEIDKLMALISLSFRNAGYEHQRLGNVAGARKTIGSTVVQKSRIQCYNCKEYGNVAREYTHNVIIESVDMHYDSKQIDQNDKDADLAKEQLKRCDSIEYASEMELAELACAKVREMKNKLSAHQDTISILKQQKDAQIKLYKSREDKEIEKVIDLENKVKLLDNVVYKTGQSVQTMNMLNNKCQTSFTKPEYLKKAKQVNPHLYDIGCYNDNLALMLTPESDEVIRLEKESRSKLSDLIRPFDYAKLNSITPCVFGSLTPSINSQ
nr:hypothetical protein [Tanacetum cinerariifolium]